MSEFNSEMEFRIPEHLKVHLDGTVDHLTRLILGMMVALYPDYDFPENVTDEILVFLIPKIISAIDSTADQILKEEGF